MTETKEQKLTSQIKDVTIFSHGAEVRRVAAFEIEKGDYIVLIEDLPQDADPQSIRIEARGDGKTKIGIVDSKKVPVSQQKEKLSKTERREIEKKIETLQDQVIQVQSRIDTLETQKKLIENLAELPFHPVPSEKGGTSPDWHKIYDLIGERLSTANEIIFKANIEQRDYKNEIIDLRQQLSQKPPQQKFITAVSVVFTALEDVNGHLSIRYMVTNASWKPFYDIRLETGQGEKGQASAAFLLIERRAEIIQNSSESWENVGLKLSTTTPSARTEASILHPDMIYNTPVAGSSPASFSPMMKMKRSSAMNPEIAPPGMEMVVADEQETEVEHQAYQSLFSVSGKTSVNNRHSPVKVFLSEISIVPDLFVQSVPKLALQAYLYAGFEWGQEQALLAGEAWLYRDGVFVGTGQLPFVGTGERHDIGFGSDDFIKVTRTEMNRITGNRGLIKNHNIDERDYLIKIKNLHDYAVETRIIDQIPFANDERIIVELLASSTQATQENVRGGRGILLWKQPLEANQEHEIRLHYKITSPKDIEIYQ